MAMYDFGPKPSWIENPPEGFMVTTAKASPDRFDSGLRRAAMDVGRQFLKDRGLESAKVGGLSPGKKWFDNETGTAYVLTDTSNVRVSDAVKLPPKKADTKTVSRPRPFEPVIELDRDADLRESVREYNRERGPEIIKEALEQPTVDLAGLEPRSRKAAPTRPSALIRERRASEDPLTDAISDDSDNAIDLAGLEPPTGTQRSAPQDRTVSRDSAMLGMPTQSTTVRQDDQLTERLVGDIQPQSGSVRGAVRAAELQQRADLPPEEETIRRGTTRSGRVIQGSKPGLFESEYTQKRGRVGRGRNEALIYGGQQTEEPGLDGSLGPFPGEADEPEYRERLGDDDPIAKRTFEKQDRESSLREDTATGGQSVGLTDPRARDAKPTTQTADTVTEPTTDAEQRGLLSRIGSLIANNPEAVASGAQLIGGLVSNAAQNRAQRRADRTTDQRVARANLISAITGGRARPTVERAQADTGGLLSLDTLGKALQGGGAAVKGELSRRVEEAERERKAKLEERGMKTSELGAKSLDTYRKAMVDLNKKQLDADTKEAAAKLAFDYLKEVRESEEGRDLSEKKITEFSSTFATLQKLDNLEDFIMSSELSFLEMGPLSLEEPNQFIFGSDSKVAKAKIQGLIGEVAQTIPGVLTEQDQKRLESRLVSLNNTKATAADIAESFREELTIRLQEDLSGFAASKFNVDYFQNELDKYLEGRGAQGFESMLTKDEIVLGG